MSVEIRLRPADVRGVLRALQRKRGSLDKPVALHGTGDPGLVEVEGVQVDVIPVRSELALRAALLDAAHDTAVAFLVDFDDRLPLDLACRLTGQKVYPVDSRSRLANLFGARKVAPGFTGTALAAILLEELPDLPPIAGTLLQPDDAWRRYLHLRLGLPLDAPVSVPALLRVAVERPEDGVRFGRRRDDKGWARLLAEAGDWLERRAGVAARAVWKAWLAGSAADMVAWLVHVDAARRAADKHATLVLRVALRNVRGAEEAWLDEALGAPLCAAAEELLSSLPAAELRALLRRAGQIFDEPEFAAARRASRWLPEGFDALQDELARGLVDALRDPAALPTALSVLQQIEVHHLATSGAHAVRAHRVREAAVRLVTWLAWLERKPLSDEPGWTGMAALARWYDEEGGFVDWARDELRTQTTGHLALDEALRPVLERVDQVRRDFDRRFAHATLAWYAAGKPATDVLPIERITRDVVKPFLEAPNRRLLVVLLDGMSVSVATRLLEAQDGWAPVTWTPGKHGSMPPAIAALPSLTSTSRAAFFAGRHEARFGNESEGQDSNRFAANPWLAGLAGTSAGPRLFLKPHLGSPNELARPLLEALRDEGERVVAVVINAIDDQLKGSDQVSVPYEQPHSIPVLERLLRAAKETERAVLLVSDHGHVPAQVMKGSKPPDGTLKHGHRYRALAAGQVADDGEVTLPEGCWKPPGAKGVAVFWDERRAWGTARDGAHGGLTLAEAVIPVRLLAPEWLHGVMQPPDDHLRTQDAPTPGWWRLRLPPTAARSRPAPQPAPQPSLFTTAPAATVEPPAPADRLHPLAEALARSDVFRAKALEQTDTQRARAIGFVNALLMASGHAISRDAFARAVGIKKRRITGEVAQIGFLNADGYTVIEEDPLADQVRLHIDRLTVQYGLRP